MMTSKTLDLICLGRAAVDLYGQQFGGRLEDMQSFTKYLGGSSANVCAGVARLGLRSSMLTRVGDEQMGRFVREALAKVGADVSHVKTDPERLTGLVILGIEGAGAYPHIFFRENCADMALNIADFDEGYIASSRAIAVTGTHLSTPSTRAAVEQAFRWARAHGTRTILDIDYRPVLWKLTSAGEGAARFIASAAATESLQSLLSQCDVVVGTEEEICTAGGTEELLAALRNIREHTSALIVLKRGAAGCVLLEEEIPSRLEAALNVPGFPVEVMNVLGAGDAFLSGFLSGWLKSAPLIECARLGNACGALVVSRHACSPAMPSEEELAVYLSRAAAVTRPDLDASIAHLHHATTVRQRREDELYVLAFDHRRQLEDLADESGAPRTKIASFKHLITRAVQLVAQRKRLGDRAGVIVDARHGNGVLEQLKGGALWVGRPIEMPGSRPITFDPPDNVALHIRSWPTNHVVKCLVFYHPEDSLALRMQQEQQVRELYAGLVELGRDLLLEVICTSQGSPVADDTTLRVMKRFYNLGVCPAWWKLEPQSESAWSEIGELIQARDPWCNGVLLLGLDAPEESLQRAFEAAANAPVCRGFAVGRSIFGAAARAWFQGAMSDEAAIADIGARYERLIDAWMQYRVSPAAAAAQTR
jgi:5-dehydro-2-deoxygluconokinase